MKLSAYALTALVQAGPDEASAKPVNGRVAGVAASLAKKGWLGRKDTGTTYLYWRTEAGQAALGGTK